ncbi:MAG: MoaD/ThiS family protein [Chloroflexi bacterium]|nr:MoaD/ThiS family protein [Chloroflexota bacterium]
MQIRVFATLRMIVGGAKVTLRSGPGNTFREMLDELVVLHPGLQDQLFRDGELSSRIHVFLNGRDIRYLGGIDMQIPEDGEVLIFPPVGGGQ